MYPHLPLQDRDRRAVQVHRHRNRQGVLRAQPHHRVPRRWAAPYQWVVLAWDLPAGSEGLRAGLVDPPAGLVALEGHPLAKDRVRVETALAQPLINLRN